jgi:hypothetical protein
VGVKLPQFQPAPADHWSMQSRRQARLRLNLTHSDRRRGAASPSASSACQTACHWRCSPATSAGIAPRVCLAPIRGASSVVVAGAAAPVKAGACIGNLAHCRENEDPGRRRGRQCDRERMGTCEITLDRFRYCRWARHAGDCATVKFLASLCNVFQIYGPSDQRDDRQPAGPRSSCRQALGGTGREVRGFLFLPYGVVNSTESSSRKRQAI